MPRISSWPEFPRVQALQMGHVSSNSTSTITFKYYSGDCAAFASCSPADAQLAAYELGVLFRALYVQHFAPRHVLGADTKTKKKK